MKYIVIDEEKNDNFVEEFDSKDEAIKAAANGWYRMTAYEKQRCRSYYVLESANPDPEADNHFDGNPIWKPEDESEITDAETDAAALFDGGWRSTDKEDLMDEYDLSEEDAEMLCNELEKLEARQ